MRAVRTAHQTCDSSVMDPHIRRQAFGLALAHARKAAGLTQGALGQAVGYEQGSVTGWERGRTEPDPFVAAKLEEAVGVRPGTLTRKLGYLPLSATEPGEPITVTDAILADSTLDDDGRTAMLSTYRALSRRRGSQQ